MSMDTCKHCDRLVDTDEDTEFYVQVTPLKTIGLCEKCRDDREQYLREEHADFQRRQRRDDRMIERIERERGR